MDTSNLLMFKTGKTEMLYGHLAGGFFTTPFRTKKKSNFILGEIAHLGIGSIWGILLTYILKKTGKDHHLIKGALISIFSLGSVIGVQKLGILKKFGLAKTFYFFIWNHLVYGLVSAQAIVLLADPTIFASSNEINKETCRQVKPGVSYPYSNEPSNEFDQSLPYPV